MKWRVAVGKDAKYNTRLTDYFTIKAETASEAVQIALKKKEVYVVKWVAEPDPNRTRS